MSGKGKRVPTRKMDIASNIAMEFRPNLKHPTKYAGCRIDWDSPPVGYGLPVATYRAQPAPLQGGETVSRLAHNQEIAGSSPASLTNKQYATKWPLC